MSQAEVRDPQSPAAIYQEIRRFDVPVDYAELVSVLQRLGRLHPQVRYGTKERRTRPGPLCGQDCHRRCDIKS